MATKQLKMQPTQEEVKAYTKGDIATREPYYWDEISQEQKIERMRSTIKTQLSQINDLRKELKKLKNHTHGSLGQVLVPYNSDNELGGDCEKLSVSRGVYF